MKKYLPLLLLLLVPAVALASKAKLALPNSSVTNLNNGLVVWYPMDGKYVTATTMTDISLTNDTATSTGFSFVAGKLGQGVHMTNGAIAARINMVDSANISPGTNDFSIAMWVHQAITGTGIIYSDKGSGTSQITLSLTGSNRFTWTIDDAENHLGGGAGLKGPPLNDVVWHHVALTRSGTSINSYVDGSLIETATISGLNFISVSSTPSPVLGGGPTLFDFVVADLDDFRFYNRALPASEVLSLYRSGTWTLRTTVSKKAILRKSI